MHVHPTPFLGRLSQQKEITELFVLTVVKLLPQKEGGGGKRFAQQDKGTHCSHAHCCHSLPHAEHLQLYLT